MTNIKWGCGLNECSCIGWASCVCGVRNLKENLSTKKFYLNKQKKKTKKKQNQPINIY